MCGCAEIKAHGGVVCVQYCGTSVVELTELFARQVRKAEIITIFRMHLKCHFLQVDIRTIDSFIQINIQTIGSFIQAKIQTIDSFIQANIQTIDSFIQASIQTIDSLVQAYIQIIESFPVLLRFHILALKVLLTYLLNKKCGAHARIIYFKFGDYGTAAKE